MLLPALLSLSTAGCTGPSAPPPAGPPGETLVVATPTDFSTLIPVVANAAIDNNLLDNLQLPILDKRFDCKLQFEPGIARSWTLSDDGTTLDLELRDDLTWSDGAPVVPRDIQLTHELMADPAVASPRIDYTQRMAGPPQITGPHALRFTFPKPYDRTTMVAHAALIPPVPSHVLDGADRATLRGHALNRSPLTTGPWTVKKHDKDSQLVIERDPPPTDDGRVPLRRVIFKVIPEYSTRLIELEKGSVDLVWSIDVADVERLRADPRLDLHRRGWRSMEYLVWNRLDPADYARKRKALKPGQELDWSSVAPHPVLASTEVRQALSLAIDVDGLMRDLLTASDGTVYGRRSVGTITPELCGAHADDVGPWPYDPVAAAAQLQAAGWVDADGDGLRERDGVPLAFVLATNAGNPRRAKAGVRIQAMLRRVGADVELQQSEAHTFWAGLRAKQFDAAISGRLTSPYPDLTPLWHSGDSFTWNYASYSDPVTDDLVDQALSEADPVKANALWVAAQARIHAEQPMTFLWWRDEVVAVDRRFQEVSIDPLSPFGHLDQWRVQPEQVRFGR